MIFSDAHVSWYKNNHTQMFLLASKVTIPTLQKFLDLQYQFYRNGDISMGTKYEKMKTLISV